MSGGRDAGGDRLRVLEPGLAEVRVEIEEARGDDDALGGDALGVSAFEPHDRLEDAVGDDDFAGAFPPGDGVDQPGLLELEPFDRLAHHGTERRARCLRAHRPASPA